MPKYKEVRADYNKDSIIVYQAYNKHIALPAIKNQKFSSPFSFKRMTWIKPSFLWMMERCGWGQKSNQEYILGVRIKRSAWEKALELSVLTDPDESVYESGAEWEERKKISPINIQWDPERTLKGGKLDYRAIQVGIGRDLIEEFNEEWILEILDYTPLVKKIYALKIAGKYTEAKRLLPKEKIYPVSEEIEKTIGISK